MVVSGQNIFDACIQGYGQLDQIITMLEDNDLNVDSQLAPGIEITYQDDIGDEDVKTFVLRNSIIFNNGQSANFPPLSGGDFNVDYNNDYF